MASDEHTSGFQSLRRGPAPAATQQGAGCTTKTREPRQTRPPGHDCIEQQVLTRDNGMLPSEVNIQVSLCKTPDLLPALKPPNGRM